MQNTKLHMKNSAEFQKHKSSFQAQILAKVISFPLSKS